MSVSNTRPLGARCWAHDRCDGCGRSVCTDCVDTVETCCREVAA